MFKLTKKELSELVVEGVVTLGIVFLLYTGMILIFNQLILSPPQMLKQLPSFHQFIFTIHFMLDAYEAFFLWFAILFAVLFTWWRLARRYRHMQLNHILDELHYIASGHFDHRIEGNVPGNMGDVVKSINTLVDSTLRALEEERKIEQSKDELITNVSHDIRTPLTSIIGYLGLIEDRQYQSEEELQKYMHIAYTKALQMKVLVDDLFEYATVRQTTTPLALTVLPLEPFLEQVAADFELEAHKNNMVIEVFAKEAAMMVEMDVDKMARVFNNLISNALKYGRGGTWIHITAEKREEEAVVSVINNGEKIPEEALENIFGRFYRVEQSRSQQTGGTGLGLAIAQSIVELHGGSIQVRSDDENTQFIIHLPLRQPENPNS